MAGPVKGLRPGVVARLTNEGVPGKIRFAVLNASKDAFSVWVDTSQGAVTPISGYAKWSIVDRPFRKGVPVFTGYDPTTLSIPILFDNFAVDDGNATERDIALLEKMAGRGVKSAHGVGPPKVITLQASGRDGGAYPIIPNNYQYNPGKNSDPPNWVISDIQWDTNPIRNAAGNRVRQAATVTVLEHIPTPLTIKAASKGTITVTSSKELNCIQAIATHSRAKVSEIRTLNNYRKNKKLDPYLRDKTKKFPRVGFKVKVPKQ